MVQSHSVNVKRLAEVAQRLYEEKLRPQLEPRYDGQIVVIDGESGDYFMGENLHEANEKARKKYPGHIFYAIKVGHPAVYSFGSHVPVSAYL